MTADGCVSAIILDGYGGIGSVRLVINGRSCLTGHLNHVVMNEIFESGE
jgi:hypothetical protein